MLGLCLTGGALAAGPWRPGGEGDDAGAGGPFARVTVSVRQERPEAAAGSERGAERLAAPASLERMMASELIRTEFIQAVITNANASGTLRARPAVATITERDPVYLSIAMNQLVARSPFALPAADDTAEGPEAGRTAAGRMKEETARWTPLDDTAVAAPDSVAHPAATANAAPHVAAHADVAPPPPPARTPPVIAHATPEPAAGHFALQVASCLNPDNAESLSARLGAAGFRTDIYQTTDRTLRQWHVVRIGGFADRPTALAARQRVAALTGIDPQVRQLR